MDCSPEGISFIKFSLMPIEWRDEERGGNIYRVGRRGREMVESNSS
jgi:hypothetical protein